MIGRIIEWSSKNKFFIFLGVILVVAWGSWAMIHTPLDAIPDLSDVQVIVFTKWQGQSPDLVEDQVTYPIVTALLSAPDVKAVRGYSYFGLSFVYVIFKDGTNLYWARSRVVEYLQGLQGSLPAGVTPTLGPDATGVGWVYMYALVDKTAHHDLAALRTFQDWYLKYWLEGVPGVSEVASVGGFVKQYQVDLNPDTLLAYHIPIKKVINAIRRSNNDVGGRVVEYTGHEYMVRGMGYIHTVADLKKVVVGTNGDGTPIYLRDVADVHLGPDIRRGEADLNGEGQVVGGIVIARYGENALAVINRVKQKIAQIKNSLPRGVQIVPVYDRSKLILSSIATLREKLIEEMVIVSIVCLIFLFHFRSALVAILTLPIAILMMFIAMYYLHLNSNIMSLSGIAIAIGAMVDGAIVMIENAHKHLEKWEASGRQGDRNSIITNAAKEVGKPLFFSLLIIAVSFIPVFTLQGQEGRMFKPLAYTKTFSMAFAALLTITLVPLLMQLLIRGKIAPEDKNPLNRFLIWLYKPFVNLSLKFPKVILFVALVALLITIPAYRQLGSEFMPPLYEGSLMYMPSGLPGQSITETVRLEQIEDKIIKGFPEVESVFGKGGRAETSTDPAPLSMGESTIVLKPESEWPKGMTPAKLVNKMNAALQIPGVSNSWTMPIKGRIDMLSTGIRTPVGIKIFGPDLATIQNIGEQIENALRNTPGTRNVFAEREVGGYYLDFKMNRDAIARYGLTVADVERVIETAIGGENVSTVVDGRERFPIDVRYMRDYRTDPQALDRVLVSTPSGAQVPIAQLATIRMTMGPPVIKTEGAMPLGYVYVDVAGVDLGTYVKHAMQVVQDKVKLPPGYYLNWSGQYEYMQRARKRLELVIPLTLLIIFVLLYSNFKSIMKTLIVMLSLPFALVGGIWLLFLLHYNTSVAVWVGFIALAGVSAEIGVVMIVYLDEAFDRRVARNEMQSHHDLRNSIMEGAVVRVRPIAMTATAIIAGLLPIMWSSGTGADVMKRIAAPMVGGMVTSTVLTLIVIPVIYAMWRGRQIRHRSGGRPEALPEPAEESQ